VLVAQPNILMGFAGDGTLITEASDTPGGTEIIKRWNPRTGKQLGQAFDAPDNGPVLRCSRALVHR
jgi:hypothetical protein